MKILQKLKFMFVRKDTPTEVRPDDMTSMGDRGSRQSAVGTKTQECCDHGSHPEHSEGSLKEKSDDCCDDHGCDCK